MKTKIYLCALAALFMIPQAMTAQTKKKAKKEVAIQLYSVRDILNKVDNKDGKCDPTYTALLKKLANMGYTGVEAANYNNGKFYDRTPQQFKKDVESAGLKVLSSHCTRGLSKEELASGDYSKSLEWWDQCIADHKAAGMKYIVAPWMEVPKTLKDLDAYCAYYNEIGKRCKQQGLSFGYHNHAHEFQKVEDKVMYDYMLEHTNPEYVFFQMDLYWVVRGQNSPVDYFNKYPGRFKIFHVKDHREIGQSGMVGFDAIFKNAKTAGVNYLVAEIEGYSMPVEESVEVTRLYSVCGLLGEHASVLKKRPFRAPHHTTTAAALTGGGRIPMPGEITLASKGILFLDELPEFSRSALEVLRQPLEEQKVTIARVGSSYEYPSDCSFVAAMNPCRCGYYPNRDKCRCTTADIKRYLAKISEPLLDRMDLCVETGLPEFSLYEKKGETSKQIRERVKRTHRIQKKRYRKENFSYNSELTPQAMKKYCIMGTAEKELLEFLFHEEQMSVRRLCRIVRVSRTIADLEESDTILESHITEAVRFRSVDRKYWGVETI